MSDLFETIINTRWQSVDDAHVAIRDVAIAEVMEKERSPPLVWLVERESSWFRVRVLNVRQACCPIHATQHAEMVIAHRAKKIASIASTQLVVEPRRGLSMMELIPLVRHVHDPLKDILRNDKFTARLIFRSSVPGEPAFEIVSIPSISNGEILFGEWAASRGFDQATAAAFMGIAPAEA